ncbi:hypothetical protein V8E51_008510 [Hyaloscypha variabilis]
MDPLTALSVAASVVQFVSYGSELVSKSRELYKSAHGTLTENAEIEEASKRLQEMTAPLQGIQGDQILEQICSGCVEVSRELVQRLDNLKVPEDHRHKKWKSFRQALKSVIGKSKIDEIEGRLHGFRMELDTHVLLGLRDMFDRFEKNIQNVVINGVPSHMVSQEDVSEKFGAMVTASQNELYKNLREFFAELAREQKELRELRIKLSVLENLRFATMSIRQETISVAYQNTFEWIFRDPVAHQKPWSNFDQWLESGNGIYWINGKAGSGKSTLMKFVLNHERTQEKLDIWSQDGKLVTPGFFFWRSGDRDQATQEGLLRSLLYDVLERRRELIPAVFPDDWEKWCFLGSNNIPISFSHWTLAKLKVAFQRLANQASHQLRFCFFIDGLDEYSGDHEDIATYFCKLSSSEFVKFCLSSRTWPLFREMFQNRPQLRLQDLTFEDIQLYIENRLSSRPRMLHLERTDPESAAQLVQSIRHKACGVFLWVDLVVKSILKGLSNRDNIQTLRRRVDAVPPDLEDLYGHMLSLIDPVYKEERSRIFRLFQISQDMEWIYWALEADLKGTLSKRLPAPDANTSYAGNNYFKDILEEMEMILQTRCGGLIEVQFSTKGNKDDTLGRWKKGGLIKNRFSTKGNKDDTLGRWKKGRLAYIHASVSDYLHRPDVWCEIISPTNCDKRYWNPEMALLFSSILCLKSLRCIELQENQSTLAYVWMRWRYVEDIIRREMDTANFHVDTAITLLDAFDAAATNLAQNFQVPCGKYWGPISLHWSQRNKSVQLPADFLSLALENEFYFYINQKLAQNRSLVLGRSRPLRGAPLLAFTLFNDRQFMDLKTIEFLLEFSADPNEQFEGYSLWQYFLHMLHTVGNVAFTSSSEREDLLRFFIVMLKSGADLSASCIQGNSCWEDIYSGKKIWLAKGNSDARVFGKFQVESLIEHGEGILEDLTTKGEPTLESPPQSPIRNHSIFTHSIVTQGRIGPPTRDEGIENSELSWPSTPCSDMMIDDISLDGNTEPFLSTEATKSEPSFSRGTTLIHTQNGVTDSYKSLERITSNTPSDTAQSAANGKEKDSMSKQVIRKGTTDKFIIPSIRTKELGLFSAKKGAHFDGRIPQERSMVVDDASPDDGGQLLRRVESMEAEPVDIYDESEDGGVQLSNGGQGMEVEPVDPRSFQDKHCLVNIIKDIFNTEEHPNGADELLELVEQIKNDQGSAKCTLPFTSLASSNGAMAQKRKYSGPVEIPWKKRH